MSKILEDVTRIASDHPETRALLVPLLKQAAGMQLHCNPSLNNGEFFMPFELVVHPRGNADYLVGAIPKVRPMVEAAMRSLHQTLSDGLSAKYRIESPPARYDVREDNRILIIVNVWYTGFQVGELKKKFPTYHDFYRVFESNLNMSNVYVGKFNGDMLKW